MAEPRQRTDWTRLERVLEDRGIDPAEFELQAVRLIQEASATYAGDPASAFTTEEASILTEGGLDLSARRVDEPDIVLRTATRLAVAEVNAALVAEVAAAMQVSPTRVRQRAVERTLYALRVDNEWRFPRWQFDEQGQPIPGIAAVVSALPSELHPVAAWRFMSEPSPDLELLDELVSPLEWLRAGGDPASVVAVAREL